MSDVPLVPVILCGGAGTRLWPMSRRQLPKQFLPLTSANTMLQETCLRALDVPGATPPLVISNEEHRFLVAEQLREAGIAAARQFLEPVGRNTAPAVAAAAFALVDDGDALMMVLPADHLIKDAAGFAQLVVSAKALAVTGLLVTFGVTPDRAETGYGYVESGEAVRGTKGFRVSRFVEKPERQKAEEFLRSGRHYWNSGMFVMSAAAYLDELRQYRPDIFTAAQNAWDARTEDRGFCRLGAREFAACPAESIDYAVMEHTDKAAVLPADIGWNDVGSWTMLWQTGEKDSAGNVVRGDVDVQDARDSYLRAESRLLSVFGVENVIIVETSDAVLVAGAQHAQSIKDVVSRLDSAGRTEHLAHKRVYRPWGYYEGVDEGEGYQVKRLMVKPGHALSLQLHHHRAEHWVVVAGKARITCGDRMLELGPNQSTYIPPETKHRLENAQSEPLFVIEVQSGSYLGEDDIVRFDDRYARG